MGRLGTLEKILKKIVDVRNSYQIFEIIFGRVEIDQNFKTFLWSAWQMEQENKGFEK